ncbi:chemotaxis protein CheB [Acaryochloris marina]|uniref:chemotaxis protein CheB n=1 Tax=Acaryochloris marina TaxID=155978 RepID=UPI001BB0CBAE|nr:chemotaxis protein CheB [Acaryochloris marina]QUY46010.1 PAS domain-containing protein [Acaryochloris marina S15]
MSRHQNKEKEPEPKRSIDEFFVVAIGASAGGLQALESFFSHLPENPGAAFVVVQHLAPDFKSLMPEILQRRTHLPVHSIEDSMLLRPNAVYVLPPRKTLRLKKQQLRLRKQPDTLNYPINEFFQSLAHEWGERTICILLSGTGSDGTQGLQEVSRAGGVALVQSPETAQFTSMPTSAIPSGLVDEILSPQELAQVVYDIVSLSASYPGYTSEESGLVDPNQLQRILDILAEREQIDFSHYKISTISRRITHRCALIRCSNLENYIRLIESSEEEQKLLRQDLLINATRFFRDLPAWEYLETQVLPQLIEGLSIHQQLRIWISACATGEEAYSMAILVDEAVERAEKPINVKIFATDLDRNSLETASSGIYPKSIANSISSERLDRYFTDEGEHYQVKRALREMLIIAPHDLTKNAGFSKMHLVSCRNVLIYMQPQLQQQVLRLLHFALAPQGALFLGNSETLGDLASEFLPLEAKWKIFRKRRDVQLPLAPLTQHRILTAIPASTRLKSRRPQFDRLLGQVYQFCFAQKRLTCFLVDYDNQLLHIFHDPDQLLEFPLGDVKVDVTELVPSAFKLPLSTALHRAKRDKEPVLYTNIKLSRGEEDWTINLRVNIGDPTPGIEDYLIVVFEVETNPVVVQTVTNFEIDTEATKRITELEYELNQTRENLQVTIEELETTNEEQQATNEELLASNEELQSTNEELQSVNEELYTVNSGYQSKIQELIELNNDIDNLLRSTNIGVVFLDHDLNIRKFTPAATRAINIRPADVGRPLAHFTHKLDYPHLVDDLKQAIVDASVMSKEVVIPETGEQLLLYVNPYLREDEVKDGVVLTFVNIDDLKQVQGELAEFSHHLEHLHRLATTNYISLEERFSDYLHTGCELLDYPTGVISQVDGDTYTIVSCESKLPNLAASSTLSLCTPHCIKVMQDKRTVVYTRSDEMTEEDMTVSLTSYIGTPIYLEGGKAIYGTLNFFSTESRYLRQDTHTKETIELMAQSIGRFLIAHQADAALRQVNAELESRVLERTTELEAANTHLSQELLERQHAEKKLRSSENKLLEAQRIARIGNWDYEVATETLTWSEGMFHIFGCELSQGPPAYADFINLLNPEDQIILDEAIQQSLTNGLLFQRDLRLDHSQGAQRHIHVKCGPVLNESKQVSHLFGTVLDITDRKAAEQVKDEFLAVVSHELRNPLAGIHGCLQLLSQQPTLLHSEEGGKLLNVSAANSRHLVRLVNDILEMERLESGRFALKRTVVQTTDLTQLAHQNLQQMMGKTQIHIEISDPGIELEADADRLIQVFNNLLENALKFSSSGGSIWLNVERGEGDQQLINEVNESIPTVLFTVKDQGRGIPQDKFEKIFERFSKLDVSNTQFTKGTGLGLSICKHIVEEHGGKIWIESTLGEGSCFFVAIPIRPSL